jgi:hypothetical protein
MYRPTYATADEVPEEVRDFYVANGSGWRFAIDCDPQEIDLLIEESDRRVDARVAAKQAELADLQAKLGDLTAERDRLRASVSQGHVRKACLEVCRGLVIPDALEDVAAAAVHDGFTADADSGEVTHPKGFSLGEWLADKLEQRRHWRTKPAAPPRRLFS